ncbi:MAG: triose-phosphate isomerase [bacterium]|nr:triose-phosphate isomerase [bacterium]
MKLLVGNWKMNPETKKKALELAKAVDKKGAIVCPPFVYLDAVSKELKNAKLGAQDLHMENSGPYTGEISPIQLKEFGVQYVIIGHSERRAMGEGDVLVAKKLKAAHENALIPILCVGESQIQRDEDKTNQVLKDQIGSALFKVDKSKQVIIAYEPIWAISSGDLSHKGASPKDIKETINYILAIAKELTDNFSLIYGGSSNSSNVKDYVSLDGIEGVLAGTASLSPDEFNKMLGERH